MADTVKVPSNINRDYLVSVDVKDSKVNSNDLMFYITDKKTSNIFIQLIINMSENELIKNYVILEDASNYKLTLNVIKPDNNVKRIEGKLLDEANAIFLFDLEEEHKDIIGVYKCELYVTCTVNSNEEASTSDSFKYTVKPSILNNLDEPIKQDTNYPILLDLIEDMKSVSGDVDTSKFATKDYVNEAIGNIEIGELDLSNYVTIKTLNESINNIELTPGPQGEAGAKGEKGDKGDNGTDGLTTSISVNGSTYTHVNGLITLPNYPEAGAGADIDLTPYAKTEDVPTKTSQLTNDSGFISSIPKEYVTETEIDSKGYLTEHQDLSNYATVSYLNERINEAQLSSGNSEALKGGSTGQVLSKVNSTDYNFQWIDPPSGGEESSWELITDISITEDVGVISQPFGKEFDELFIVFEARLVTDDTSGQSSISCSLNSSNFNKTIYPFTSPVIYVDQWRRFTAHVKRIKSSNLIEINYSDQNLYFNSLGDGTNPNAKNGDVKNSCYCTINNYDSTYKLSDIKIKASDLLLSSYTYNFMSTSRLIIYGK